MKRSDLNLTKRLIDSFTFEGKHAKDQDIRWDAKISGFGVRVYPTGRKAFVLSYRDAEGRKHIMKVGDFPTMTLDTAKEKAIKALGEVSDGESPLRKRQEARTGQTVAELCTRFLSDHASQKKTASEYERRIKAHILPAWGSRLAKTIKREDVAKLHQKVGERGKYEANRVLALASVLFHLGQTWGYVPEGAPNPAHGLQPFREVKRDRWVKPAELPRLAEAIDREGGGLVRAALWLYLLTGARRSELLKAKWEDVDMDRAELRLPDTKAGRIHYIPLSGPALSILGSLPRMAGNPYVFPGRKDGRPLVNIAKSWRRVRQRATLAQWADIPEAAEAIGRLGKGKKREPTCEEVRAAVSVELPAGLEDVRLHDLRRTVGSWLATAGASLPLIGKTLGHTQPSTTAIYARLTEDPVRKALEDHGARLMEASKPLRLVKSAG